MINEHKNVIFACHITGVFDVNRKETLSDDDFSLVKEWADSLMEHDICGVLFHNNFSESTISKQQSKNLKFVKIEHDKRFNPNVYRYFVYKNFLDQQADFIQNLFLTDVSDVVVLNNPFTQELFTINPNYIFCGDEPKSLENEWMFEHSSHFRGQIPHFEKYESKYQKAALLNCGIVGGKTAVMQEFLTKVWDIHFNYNQNNQTAYTGDMGAFNFILRTHFNNRLIHGFPCNTIFKDYENDRKDCWFRHK